MKQFAAGSRALIQPGEKGSGDRLGERESEGEREKKGEKLTATRRDVEAKRGKEKSRLYASLEEFFCYVAEYTIKDIM